MTFTAADAKTCTFLALRIRKETPGAGPWDEHGTHTVISELVGQHFVTTLERIIRHAADIDARNPGSIRRPFVPPAPTPTTGTNPPVGALACKIHPDRLASNCGLCRSEPVQAYYDPPEPPTPADANAARIAAGLPPKHQETS